MSWKDDWPMIAELIGWTGTRKNQSLRCSQVLDNPAAIENEINQEWSRSSARQELLEKKRPRSVKDCMFYLLCRRGDVDDYELLKTRFLLSNESMRMFDRMRWTVSYTHLTLPTKA